MTTILITGGAGFIGSHLARWCINKGYTPLVVDNCSTGREENVPTGAEFIRGDITDPALYTRLVSYQIDAVFHLAAQSSGEVSFDDPVADMRVNTLGTLQMLEHCKKNGINRFIYASSMAAYGNPDNNPVCEDIFCRPLSFYGISKRCSEEYVNHYSGAGIHTTIFRMFSVYGPGQNLSNMKQGMVSIFLAYVLQNEPVIIKGSLERFRDFIYINDVCRAWMDALFNASSYGKTYNLATGKKTTVGELVRLVCSAMNRDPDSYPVVVSGVTPDDQFGLYADISRLTHDIGWTPGHDLKRGLDEMARWAEKEADYGR